MAQRTERGAVFLREGRHLSNPLDLSFPHVSKIYPVGVTLAGDLI